MRKPLTVDPLLTSYYQHEKKQVYSNRLIDDMSDASAFELRQSNGAGSMITKAGEQGLFSGFERAERDGKPVMRLKSAVMSGPPNSDKGRGWGNATLCRVLNGEDWANYNRVSFEVYPDLPGFRTVSLCLYLFNEGEIKLPFEDTREGIHFIILKNHQWNFCTWEFPELARDKVTAFGFEYRLQGSEPGACDTVLYDFTNLKLEKVDADHVKGWEPKTGEISFSHTGYTPDSKKTAISKGLIADRFEIVRSGDGQPVYSGKITIGEYHTGSYQVLDFSDLKTEGRYYIKAGGKTTRPFSIGANVWRETVKKAINSFWCLRCG
jgi:hypothetical protein